jgi:transcriptional regulator with XRE-family HTH domain
MRHVQLDREAVTAVAAANGINTVSELARRCARCPGSTLGSQSYMRRVLNGERPALPGHVLTLAKVLDVKPSRLLDKSEAELGEALDAAVAEEVASA